jgi:hypothetical protein
MCVMLGMTCVEPGSDTIGAAEAESADLASADDVAEPAVPARAMMGARDCSSGDWRGSGSPEAGAPEAGAADAELGTEVAVDMADARVEAAGEADGAAEDGSEGVEVAAGGGPDEAEALKGGLASDGALESEEAAPREDDGSWEAGVSEDGLLSELGPNAGDVASLDVMVLRLVGCSAARGGCGSGVWTASPSERICVGTCGCGLTSGWRGGWCAGFLMIGMWLR